MYDIILNCSRISAALGVEVDCFWVWVWALGAGGRCDGVILIMDWLYMYVGM